jgi:hypothetical protein
VPFDPPVDSFPAAPIGPETTQWPIRLLRGADRSDQLRFADRGSDLVVRSETIHGSMLTSIMVLAIVVPCIEASRAMTLTDSRSIDLDTAEIQTLFKEARRRRRVRWLVVVTALIVMTGVAVSIAVERSSPTRSVPLLARPLHYPSLGSDGSCPATSGTAFHTFFNGIALGRGPVRVLLADSGDIRHGRVDLSPSVRGWFALQTLWFAMPGYNGPFVVRAERIGRKGPIEAQPSGMGLFPGSGPLVVSAGPTDNTADGYRTVPGSTWVKSGGCYAWQVDGQNFSEVIVVDALASPSKWSWTVETMDPVAGMGSRVNLRRQP